MTRKLCGPPMMELDLDAFLQSQSQSTSGDDDDDHLLPNPIPHRTVDDILNDSDSSSSTPSSPSSSYLPRPRLSSDRSVSHAKQPESPPKQEVCSHHDDDDVSVCSPKTLSDSRLDESLTSSERQFKFSSINRKRSGDFPGSFDRNALCLLPPLFGGVRSNAKPGAALAAAAAASRSIPTPHAAAIKSRRARSSATLHKVVLHAEELGSESGISEVVSDGGADFGGFGLGLPNDVSGLEISQSVEQDGKMGDSHSKVSGEFSGRERIVERSHRGGEVSPDIMLPAQVSGADDVSRAYNSEQVSSSTHVEQDITCSLNKEEDWNLNESSTISVPNDIKDKQVQSSSPDELHSDVSSLILTDDTTEYTQKGIPSPPGSDKDSKAEEDLTIAMYETQNLETVMPYPKDQEASLAEDDASSTGDVTDLIEERILQWESERSSKRAEKRSRSSMKPLELAEELEKKHSFTGLHWEEGAAAQPMRLEGVRRGSTALGYFDIDANNTITRTISSLAFRRDHGSPQVVAVHLNFIAVGMSKGLVVIMPSKYSPHCADNLDAKVVLYSFSHATFSCMYL